LFLRKPSDLPPSISSFVAGVPKPRLRNWFTKSAWYRGWA